MKLFILFMFLGFICAFSFAEDAEESFEQKDSLQPALNLLYYLFSEILSKMASAGTGITPISQSRNLFAADLYQKVGATKPTNVVFSPASIQTCLAMAFLAANGKTADEMRQALKFGNANREDIAKNFEEFMKNSFKTTKNNDAVQMNMANRIYVNENLQLKSKFNKMAKKTFNSEAKKLNFADSSNAVAKINQFVEKHTQQKIKNLLQPGTVNGETSVVLVNAIYFKGKWQTPFSSRLTTRRDFVAYGTSVITVDMMFMKEEVKYGEIAELDAKAIELPYKNSNLSMLLLLPNTINGLEKMEKKLAGKDLNQISSSLKSHKVKISLPKFRIEYDIDLSAPLKEMGLATMFTNHADFSELLDSPTKQKVSDVRHKAFIDVNEAGSEAAAASSTSIVLMSVNFDKKAFNADHPFFFAIRDSKAVYFAGHVLEP